jgi:hypothetical protein
VLESSSAEGNGSDLPAQPGGSRVTLMRQTAPTPPLESPPENGGPVSGNGRHPGSPGPVSGPTRRSPEAIVPTTVAHRSSAPRPPMSMSSRNGAGERENGAAGRGPEAERAPEAERGTEAERGATAPQLRRFIKSRAYVPMHELRRRFGINGADDEVTPVDLDRERVFVGLPEREGRLLGELLRGGDIGYELSLDPISPIVVGVYPMRPVTRA